jgi:hypothetical protein
VGLWTATFLLSISDGSSSVPAATQTQALQVGHAEREVGKGVADARADVQGASAEGQGEMAGTEHEVLVDLLVQVRARHPAALAACQVESLADLGVRPITSP